MTLTFPKPTFPYSTLSVVFLSTAECPDLTDPANGMVVMAGNLVGNTATYTCDPGFALVGAPTVTCQANGMWSDSPPTCEPIGMKSPLYCRVIIMAFTNTTDEYSTYHTEHEVT